MGSRAMKGYDDAFRDTGNGRDGVVMLGGGEAMKERIEGRLDSCRVDSKA